MKEEEINSYKKIFDLLDFDHTGVIFPSDFIHLAKSLKIASFNEKIFNLLSNLDKREDLSYGMTYDQFLSALTIDITNYSDKENLEKIFLLLDDGSGKITFDNLQKILAQIGEQVSKEELREMIKVLGDINGAISKETFFKIFS